MQLWVSNRERAMRLQEKRWGLAFCFTLLGVLSCGTESESPTHLRLALNLGGSAEQAATLAEDLAVVQIYIYEPRKKDDRILNCFVFDEDPPPSPTRDDFRRLASTQLFMSDAQSDDQGTTFVSASLEVSVGLDRVVLTVGRDALDNWIATDCVTGINIQKDRVTPLELELTRR